MQATQTNYSVPPESDLPTGMFRTYDIRGAAGEGGITENVAYAIGLAIGTEALAVEQHEVVVGRDGRLTGATLKAALSQGICDTGCDVMDVGMVPSPVVYFATNFLETSSGVMVTASHNPGHHNGFKIVLNGRTLSTAAIQSLYQRIVRQDFAKGAGKIKTQDVAPDYLECITQKVQLAKPLKVVIDCGNGAGGELAPILLRSLGCEVVELFCEIDGNFPNHHPDPTIPENLNDLIAAVKEHGADIGLALDGDADRLGVVTDKGEIIWPDRQIMVFARDVLSRLPGAQIVFDVKCSSILPQIIAQSGGVPIMHRTGHSVLKAKMLEIGAPLAGEMSGHIFFQEDWFGFDDGLYVAARLLKILTNFDGTVTDLFAELPQSVSTSELKIPMAEADKLDFMRHLLAEGDFGDVEKITIDGLRVDFGFGFGLVRPSNTSAYLTVRFEADTAENLTHIKETFRTQLQRFSESLDLPW